MRQPVHLRLARWQDAPAIGLLAALAASLLGCTHPKTPVSAPAPTDETQQQQLKKDFAVVEIHYPDGTVISKPTRVDSGFVVPRADSILRAWDAYENSK